MILAILFIVIGFIVLITGGELLVRGASRLARIAGVSPLVIGLTVVSFGTSSPEFAVSIKANLSGQADIAVGNVVGSNIVNVLLVLGASAMIAPLVVASQLIRFDVPLMIGASVLTLIFSLGGTINFFEGMVLFTALVLYVGWSIVQSRRETAAVREEFEHEFNKPAPRKISFVVYQFVWLLLGLFMLWFGSNLLVTGAADLASLLGMSQLMIGLTIVAIGTSLPELVASMIACWRNERDIAVGNVVGSNIFNILGVLGLSAIVAPKGVPVGEAAIQFDIPIMIAVAVACLPIFMTGHVITRLEGAIFISYYISYMTYLISAAIESKVSDYFSFFMIGFMVPVTVVALLFGFARVLRDRRHRGRPDS